MFKKLAITAALATALAAPAQANEDIFKGVLATIIIHKVMNSHDQGYSDGHEVRPAPQLPSPRSAPGYYDQTQSCRVDVHRGDYYTTRTVYNCYGAILEHETWPSN